MKPNAAPETHRTSVHTIELTADDVEPPDSFPLLKAAAGRTLSELGIESYEIGIVVCSDNRMKSLNGRYRGIDESTDVLTFSQQEGDPVPAAGELNTLRGDIVISTERVQSNSAIFGVPAAEELVRVVVHGVLHLAGYEHNGIKLGDAGAAHSPMLALQEIIVRKISKENES
jgi:probable rRNA maturation factor